MNARPVFAIPVKPFGVAKQRLSAVLTPETRTRLGRMLAEHAIRAVSECGAIPLVLSADDGVTEWATTNGTDVLLDEGSSLDRAAELAAMWATERRLPWAILHADLPLLTPAALAPAVAALGEGDQVIAPSSDGGTSLLGSTVPISFSYGRASFHRHLSRLGPSARVLVSTALALDLDEPLDLAAALSHPDGAWLTEVAPPDTVR